MVLSLFKLKGNTSKDSTIKNYISSKDVSVLLYDLEYNKSIKINRGEEVDIYKFKEKKEDDIYIKIKYNDEFYLINQNNLTDKKEEIIKEKEMFVRTNLTVYKNLESSKILSYIKKGEKVEIIGYDKIKNGIVNKHNLLYRYI